MELLALLEPDTVVRLLEAGSYVLLFGLLFACGLGLPLPEDIPLLAAGALVARGRMDLLIASIAAWAGIIGGDCVLYFLSRRYGMNITRLPLIGKHVTRERIERVERLFEDYGIWVVAVGRLFAGIRGAMVVAAGVTKFNFLKFFITDGIAALISGGLFVWLGYVFGKNLPWLTKKVKEGEHWFLGGVVLIVVCIVAYVWWRKRKHRGVTDVALEKAVEVAEHHHPHTPPGPMPGAQPEGRQ
jgi:membrane protein DedA with SNARE-associated domain